MIPTLKTIPSNQFSIDSALENLSEASKVALVDICEAFIDGYVNEELGFTFKFNNIDTEEYTSEVADELLSSGLIYLHDISIDGSWLVFINIDLIHAVAAIEDLDTDNDLAEL
jgi:hypothetical protein